MQVVSFWCEKCKEDVDLLAGKDIRAGAEYFFAHCRKKHKVVRYITERRIDPYFSKSLKVRKEKIALSRDLIQPGQDGFKTYYTKQWEKIEKANEEFEKKQEQKRQSRELYYKKLREDVSTKYLAGKIIEAEEKMEYA